MTKELPKITSYESEASGKIRVRRLPIFAEGERRFPDGTVAKIDLQWLVKATESMRARKVAQNFTPAAHLGHHDYRTKDERPAVGVLEEPALEQAMFEGKPTWVMFSDVLLDGKDDLEKLKKHRFRSVEVLDLKDPRIDSLAFLQSRPPFHKFPNLELAPAGGAVQYHAPVGEAGAAFGWAEPLQFAGEPPMADQNAPAAAPAQQPKPGEGEDGLGEIKKMLQQLLSIFMPPQQAQQQPVMQAAAEPVKPLQAAAAPVPALKVLEGGATTTASVPPPVVAPTPAPAPQPVTFEATPPAATAALATAASDAAAFAAKVKATLSAKKNDRAEALSWAENELKDRGTGEVEELRALLVKQFDAGGRQAVEVSVATIKELLPSLPGPAAHADHADKGTVGETPEVLAYAHDPVALRRAGYVKSIWEKRPVAHREDTLASWLDCDPDLYGKAGAKG